MSVNKEREVPIIIVRKKVHAHAHHGGAWKVAFADFMTAMFALFLVLWLVNQSSDVKSAIAGYFQDPLGRANEFGSSIMPGEGAQSQVARPLNPADIVDLHTDRMQSMAKRLEERIQEQPSLQQVADKIEIRMTAEGLEIQLLEDSLGVFFEVGGSAPSLRGRQILALLGQELGKLPNPVLVSGYTDSRRYQRPDGYSNWELSTDRANTTRRILMINGVADKRFTQVRGFADRELRVPRDPYAPSNRRVTITMLFADGEAHGADGGRAGPPVSSAAPSAGPEVPRPS
jgi:chemotaxis protein MotB